MGINPFRNLRTCAESVEDIESLCVDRFEELETCIHALITNYHNLLLYGTRGIGKTFLVRLIEIRLKRELPKTFVAYVRPTDLLAYGNIDPVASFSRAALLQVCTEIWTGLLEKSYLELRERLNETGQELTFRPEPEKVIQVIYSLLMKSHIRIQNQMTDTVGFSAGVKGEKKETRVKDFQQSDILPFEFAEFAHELKEKVLKPFERERLIILCDDANQMPIFHQEAILERYFDLFNSKQVQFLFVVGFMPWETEMPVPLCFETQLQLNGFPDKSYLKELIEKVNCQDVEFEDSSIEVLFDYFKGHPFYSIQLFAKAFDHALESTTRKIDGVLMARLCREYDDEMKKQQNIFMKKRH